MKEDKCLEKGKKRKATKYLKAITGKCNTTSLEALI